MSEKDFVKLLVMGDSGSGKTCLSCSFPGPLEVWDFDNKISSAAKFYAKQPEILNNIEVKSFAQLPKDQIIPEMQKRLREVNELAMTGKPLPFKTLVLDSFTTFAGYLLAAYPKLQPGIKRQFADIPALQDYQLLDIHLGDTVKNILKLNCNIVVTGHLTSEKDETTGAITYKPLVPGKFADKLNIYFEEVYLSKVTQDGKFVLQTQPDSKFKLRSQRQLPKEIPNQYSSIINK